MKRKAYRCYYRDRDKSFINNDKYFLIKPLEIIEYQDVDKTFKLGKNQGLRAFVFDKEKMSWEKIVAFEKDISIKGYVLRLEVFDYSQTDLEIAKEYASVVFPVKRGKLFQNGNKVAVITGPTISDAASKNLTKIGMFNNLGISRSIVSGEIGNRNLISVIGECKIIPPMAICPRVNIIARDENYITLSPKGDTSSFLIAIDNNYIKADNINEVCVFRNNNKVIDPDLDIKDLYLLPQKPKLAFSTFIVSDGKEGDDFVEVENTSFVLGNIRFMFSSKEAGFVFRKVRKVKGNRIYFDKPVSKKEIPIKNGLCFSEAPKELDEIKSITKKDMNAYSRRVYIDKIDESVFLREVTIGDFKTTALYYDAITSLLIVDKVTKEPIRANTKVEFEGFKFVGPFEFEIGKELPNLYIGQKVYIEDTEYIVKGFDLDEKTIEFKEASFEEVKGKKAHTNAIESSYYNSLNIPFFKLKVLKGKRYLDTIQVEDHEGLKKGAYVMYKNTPMAIQEVIRNDKGTFLKLEHSFIPFVLDNAIIKGDFVSFDEVVIDEIINISKAIEKLKG